MIKLNKPLLLASSSESRKMLLARLQIPFESHSPDIDEAPQQNELPATLASRLALAKAQAVAQYKHNYYIVASDQVAICGDRILSKPLNKTTAIEQLTFQSGKTTTFYTSLCLLNSCDNGKQNSFQLDLKTYQVKFRRLSNDEIRTYVEIDKPLNCAGSFKAESAGISLFDKLEGDDPTTLVGLPLILLSKFLRNVAN